MMKSNALFFGWDYPRVGREKQAAELYQALQSYWRQHKEKGNIGSFETVTLTSTNTGLSGFFLVRGEREKLSALRHSDEFMKLVLQSKHILNGFSLIDGYVGDEANNVMENWMKMIG